MIQISTKDSLKFSGHYFQAIIYNDIYYVSAQLPIDPFNEKENMFQLMKKQKGYWFL